MPPPSIAKILKTLWERCGQNGHECVLSNIASTDDLDSSNL